MGTTALAAAATVGPLHTTGTDRVIYDASNQPVRLVGFNWFGMEVGGRNDYQKIADVCGSTWRTPTDLLAGVAHNFDNMYSAIRGWGYNVIRVPMSWNNLEPVAPVWSTNLNAYVHTWNQTYLADLKSMVTKARAAGVMVILDMQQDFWSPSLHNITNWDGTPGYCEGFGMPRWLNPSIDVKAATDQNVDFYNAMNWFYRNIHDPMSTTTRSTPWQLFSAAWEQLSFTFSPASGFADYAAVVGADILNEPYSTYVGGSPPAGQTVLQASGSRLASFYNALAPAITANNASWLLFFNDSQGGYNAANPAARETPTMTGKPSAAGNWVYAMHDYNFKYETFNDGVVGHDDFGITLANVSLANASAWGVPLYMGEFTIFYTFGTDARLLTDANMAETKKFVAWAKLNNVSWTFWSYMSPYRPMTLVDYSTNQAIPVVKNALDTGLDSQTPNLVPLASFTSSVADLVASFDGAASADPDGSIISYSWAFGDGGAAGSGVSPSHTYAAAGTYQVTLTVTDNQGGTGVVTHPVVVSLPAGSPFIVDTFGRTVASGWGSAETGGVWAGSTSSLSVSGGTGVIRVAAAGTGPGVFLAATTSTDADLTVAVSSDKVGTGNGVYLSALGRRVAGADYRVQTRLRSDGLVAVSIVRADAAGAQTVIAGEVTVPGYTFVAGARLNVRFQVTGTTPTTLRAKVWPATGTQPVAWLRTGTDSTAGLQVAGGIGFMAYLSGAATNAPVTTTFDDLSVRPTTVAPPNQNPTAAFTSSAVNLVASFNGSTSSDPDGNIASYSWNFNDATPAGTGATPSHTYAAAGTYQVTLTVTDNQGATNAVTHPITVTSGGAVVTLASDDFGRTLSGSWGAANLGGTWSVTSPTNSSVGGGVGRLVMGAAGTGPAAYLSGMSTTDADVQVQLGLDRLPLGGTSGADLSLIARRVGTEDYRGKARILSTGAVRVSIARVASNGAQTSLTGETTVAGLTYAVGDQLVLRVQATGTSPTQLKVKVWKLGTTEPATWALTSSDSTASLQTAGRAGIHAYLSAAVTNPPVTASYDGFRVFAASTLP